jgi:hypothetical protein
MSGIDLYPTYITDERAAELLRRLRDESTDMHTKNLARAELIASGRDPLQKEQAR